MPEGKVTHKITREQMVTILIMRGLGYDLNVIGKQIGVTPQAVKYYLDKFQKRAQEEGITVAFWSLVLGPLGAPIVVFSALERIISEVIKE